MAYCLPLNAAGGREPFGGAYQGSKDPKGRGQRVTDASVLYPQQKVVGYEPPFCFDVDLRAPRGMLLGHDCAREIAIFAEEAVLLSPHLVLDGDLGADELATVPDESVFADCG